MGWKEWPSWLKGGLIGLCFGVLIVLLRIPFQLIELPKILGIIIGEPYMAFIGFSRLFIRIILDTEICRGTSIMYYVIFSISTIIIYLILGIIYGLVINKTKNRKTLQKILIVIISLIYLVLGYMMNILVLFSCLE